MPMPAAHHPHDADHADLVDLYERHAAPIRRLMARLTSDPDAAEDLCHDTFLKAVRGWSTRRQGGNALAWLYRIARHTAYDHLRRRRRMAIAPLRAAEHADIDRSDRLVTGRGRLTLAWTLAALPPHTRMVLLLFVAGYPTHEIALWAGTSNSAIKSLINRRRTRLRAQDAG
jgi:RNA polymerase sigma-70 factor (ECF subfamily)